MEIGFDKIKARIDKAPNLYKYLANPYRGVFVYANILLYTFAGILTILRLFSII